MPSLKKPTNYKFSILKSRANSKFKSLKNKKKKKSKNRIKRVPKYEKLQEVEELQPIYKLKNTEEEYSIPRLIDEYI